MFIKFYESANTQHIRHGHAKCVVYIVIKYSAHIQSKMSPVKIGLMCVFCYFETAWKATQITFFIFQFQGALFIYLFLTVDFYQISSVKDNILCVYHIAYSTSCIQYFQPSHFLELLFSPSTHSSKRRSSEWKKKNVHQLYISTITASQNTILS